MVSGPRRSGAGHAVSSTVGGTGLGFSGVPGQSPGAAQGLLPHCARLEEQRYSLFSCGCSSTVLAGVRTEWETGPRAALRYRDVTSSSPLVSSLQDVL